MVEFIGSLLGSLLLFILFCVLFVIILGVCIIAKLVGGWKNLWNIVTGNRINRDSRRNTSYEDKGNQQTASDNQGDRPHSKGVFKDDEGTYVDFEEINE